MHPKKRIHEARRNEDVCARLRRIAGHVRAVERMIDTDRSYIELMNQLAAVQTAIRNTADVILRSHVQAYVDRSGSTERTHARADQTSRASI